MSGLCITLTLGLLRCSSLLLARASCHQKRSDNKSAVQTLQLQVSLVITVRCCQAGTLPCSCACGWFLNFAHGRWLVFFRRKEFGQQGRCVHLHNLQGCLMFAFSCRSFFLLELPEGREFWLHGCEHVHSWQDLTVIVSRVPQHCASLPVGSASGFLPFESRASSVFLS